MIKEKYLIFLGGEAGVGKSIVAKEIQKEFNNSIIIDKDETTSVLTNALLESLGQRSSDRESDIYLKNVKPLEYKQLDNFVWNSFLNTSLIVTAPYFDSFQNKEWIDTMEALADFHNAKVSFIFITRCPNKIQSGLVARGKDRDEWKINNHGIYRKNTDKIISDVLKNKRIKHADFHETIELPALLQLITNTV